MYKVCIETREGGREGEREREREPQRHGPPDLRSACSRRSSPEKSPSSVASPVPLGTNSAPGGRQRQSAGEAKHAEAEERPPPRNCPWCKGSRSWKRPADLHHTRPLSTPAGCLLNCLYVTPRFRRRTWEIQTVLKVATVYDQFLMVSNTYNKHISVCMFIPSAFSVSITSRSIYISTNSVQFSPKQISPKNQTSKTSLPKKLLKNSPTSISAT